MVDILDLLHFEAPPLIWGQGTRGLLLLLLLGVGRKGMETLHAHSASCIRHACILKCMVVSDKVLFPSVKGPHR